jgi:hypothetical protein
VVADSIPIISRKAGSLDVAHAASMRIERLEQERAIAITQRDEDRDCGQDAVCRVPPGCQRHWERNRELVRERDEARLVLRMLLDLHDPPSEARRRRHAEDEHGWNLALGGAVRIGRQIIPRPDPCRMCRGGGADEYGAECGDCDGEGYKRAPEPVTPAEKAVWDRIRREVSERAREE